MWKIVDSRASHETPFISGIGAATADDRLELAATTGTAVNVGRGADVATVLEPATCGVPGRLAVSTRTAAATAISNNNPPSTMAVGKPARLVGDSIVLTLSTLERSTPVTGVTGAAVSVCAGGCRALVGRDVAGGPVGGRAVGGWLRAPAIGRPQPRHTGARSDTSRPQSGHLIRATAPPYTRPGPAQQLTVDVPRFNPGVGPRSGYGLASSVVRPLVRRRYWSANSPGTRRPARVCGCADRTG